MADQVNYEHEGIDNPFSNEESKTKQILATRSSKEEISQRKIRSLKKTDEEFKSQHKEVTSEEVQGNATVFSNLQEKPSSSSINIFANKGHHSVNLLESKPEKHNASTDLASSEEYASGIKLSKSKAVVYADDKAEYDEIFAADVEECFLQNKQVPLPSVMVSVECPKTAEDRSQQWRVVVKSLSDNEVLFKGGLLKIPSTFVDSGCLQKTVKLSLGTSEGTIFDRTGLKIRFLTDLDYHRFKHVVTQYIGVAKQKCEIVNTHEQVHKQEEQEMKPVEKKESQEPANAIEGVHKPSPQKAVEGVNTNESRDKSQPAEEIPVVPAEQPQSNTQIPKSPSKPSSQKTHRLDDDGDALAAPASGPVASSPRVQTVAEPSHVPEDLLAASTAESQVDG